MTRKNLADQLPEPPDGTRLLIIERLPRAIWRDDAEASTDTSNKTGEHWFEDEGTAMSWEAILGYATAIYAVATEPLVPPRPGKPVAVEAAKPEDFEEGDAVWISDGYAGSPHAAEVTVVDHGLLHARGPRLAGDSRVPFWAIPAAQVGAMVKRREIPEV